MDSLIVANGDLMVYTGVLGKELAIHANGTADEVLVLACIYGLSVYIW